MVTFFLGKLIVYLNDLCMHIAICACVVMENRNVFSNNPSGFTFHSAYLQVVVVAMYYQHQHIYKKEIQGYGHY